MVKPLAVTVFPLLGAGLPRPGAAAVSPDRTADHIQNTPHNSSKE
jgi:hypothetical protein